MTLLGICLKKSNNTSLKRYMHPNVHSSIIYETTIWKQLMSITRYVDKGDVVYMYIMEYYSAIKKIEILPFAQHGWIQKVLYLVK